jgi:hypothetical protein
MSITYPSVDQAAASPLSDLLQELDREIEQQPSGLPYVGTHRRRDGQGRHPDMPRWTGHHARHRRGR